MTPTSHANLPTSPLMPTPPKPATVAITLNEQRDEITTLGLLIAQGIEAPDEERIAAYNADQWEFVGIQARADLLIPYGEDFITASIESPGLWGIESDSTDEYKQEVYEEERAVLLDMLASISQAISQPVSQPEKPTPPCPPPCSPPCSTPA